MRPVVESSLVGGRVSELRGRGDREDHGDTTDKERTPADDPGGDAPTDRVADERESGGDSSVEPQAQQADRQSNDTLSPREKLNRYLDDLYWPGYPAPAEPDQEGDSNGSATTQLSSRDAVDDQVANRGPEAAGDDATSRPATDAGPQHEDDAASYPPELPVQPRYDDTLARLQYLNNSNTLSSPEPAADSSKRDSRSGTAANAEAESADDHEAALSHRDEHADLPESAPERPGDAPELVQPARADDQGVETAEDGESGRAAPVDQSGQSGDQAATTDADPNAGSPIGDRPGTDSGKSPGGISEPESPRSGYAELVVERDKSWDHAEAALPPGALPASTKSLSAEVVDALDPDVRRVLEYLGASEYIAAHKDQRPWLEPASNASPQVQRLFTAIDQGNGHAHIRHGPMGPDQLYADRVARMEDPAQTDPSKRATCVDGLNESKLHYCAQTAARIHDPEAFVAAFAGAVRHPDVRAALDTEWDEDVQLEQVAIPIAELLGPSGYESCSGFRLAGDAAEAKRNRKLWVKARAEGRDLADLPEPQAERIPTFEGGDFIVRFGSNIAERRYEIITMYPEPPDL